MLVLKMYIAISLAITLYEVFNYLSDPVTATLNTQRLCEWLSNNHAEGEDPLIDCFDRWVIRPIARLAYNQPGISTLIIGWLVIPVLILVLIILFITLIQAVWIRITRYYGSKDKQ